MQNNVEPEAQPAWAKYKIYDKIIEANFTGLFGANLQSLNDKL